MAQIFENRGTLMDLATFPVNLSDIELSTTDNEDRGKEIHWLKPKSTMASAIAVSVDNVFWKNSTVSFMVKNLVKSTTTAKKYIISYNDNEGRNSFEIYTANNKVFLSSQMVAIDVSEFDWSGEHLFTATRDWDTGNIRVWQDKTQILAAYFLESDFAIANEVDTAVLANEPDTAIIVIEPTVITRGSLDRTKKLYFFGTADNGVAVPNCYIADFHIWDWAFDQEYIESVYDTSMITMTVDRLTRYLGEFRAVPPLARTGDSFKWVGISNDLFQNGQVYWLTPGGWSILRNNAEYITTGE